MRATRLNTGLAEASMKVFVLETPTGRYFQGLNKWTTDPDQAFDFKLVPRALKYIEIWGLKEVELAFAFGGLSPAPALAAREHARV